jgi:hypothetical protein
MGSYEAFDLEELQADRSRSYASVYDRLPCGCPKLRSHQLTSCFPADRSPA